MVSFKNFILYGLLAFNVAAAPTPDSDVEVMGRSSEAEIEQFSPNYHLMSKRKNANKCEAHIHVDTSNGICTIKCTDKYTIDLLDNTWPGNVMGYDWNWKNLGSWKATNPNYQIKIKTTKGPELWIDGGIPGGWIKEDKWRTSFTLHYGNQHWNSHECQNWKLKTARPSNGHRHEFDLWCEFDC